MIEIVIAMQDPIIAKTNPVVAGLDLSTMDSATLSEFGIRTYNARVAIPGAPLLSVPQATQSSSGDNGMGAMGL